MDVCKTDDEFVRNIPRWVAYLSNGETIYQDDGRPGIEEPSAWIRLGQYCRANCVTINELWLQFRSNRIRVGPPNAAGYYFTKGVFAVWGDSKSWDFVVAGALVDNKIVGGKWIVPELILFEEVVREPDEKNPCLIRNG